MRTSPETREWPLIAFTLLGQCAAGMLAAWYVFELLDILPLLSGSNPSTAIIPGAVTLLLGAAGLLAALHLQMPLRAVLAAANWKNSWLSREMIFSLLFGLTALLLTLLQISPMPLVLVRLGLRLLTLIFAALLVWSMVQLYRLRTVPVWNAPATIISFLGSCLLLGPGTLLILLNLAARWSGLILPHSTDSLVSGWLILILIIQLLNWQTHKHRLKKQGRAARSSANRTNHSPAAGIRYLSASAALLTGAAITTGLIEGPLPVLVLVLLIIIEETMGRSLFYTAYERNGF